MKKDYLPVALLLVLAGFLTSCKDTSPEFSPGASDPRIRGTWQLYERRFIKDSIYSVRIDTVVTTRDTSFYSLKRYTSAIPQRLSFGDDGKLTAVGSEMTYYKAIQYFRVDSTPSYGLAINLFVSTNGANVPFREGLEFRQDTLVLKPQYIEGLPWNKGYYLKLVRAR